jgi:hypothetical protein
VTIYQLAFTLGIDYGTNSVRALFVDVSDGRELATCVVESGGLFRLLKNKDADTINQMRAKCDAGRIYRSITPAYSPSPNRVMREPQRRDLDPAGKDHAFQSFFCARIREESQRKSQE